MQQRLTRQCHFIVASLVYVILSNCIVKSNTSRNTDMKINYEKEHMFKIHSTQSHYFVRLYLKRYSPQGVKTSAKAQHLCFQHSYHTFALKVFIISVLTE